MILGLLLDLNKYTRALKDATELRDRIEARLDALDDMLDADPSRDDLTDEYAQNCDDHCRACAAVVEARSQVAGIKLELVRLADVPTYLTMKAEQITQWDHHASA